MIFHYNGEGTTITAVVVHGSVQTYYDEHHRLIKLLKKYCKEILSIVLPGHGSSVGSIEDPKSLSVEISLSRFRTELLTEITAKKVVFVGYSIGGLFGLKIWPDLARTCTMIYGIFIGCGLRIHPEHASLIKQFFSPEFFETIHWDTLTQQHHGATWKALVLTVAQWLNSDSKLFLTTNELESLQTYEHTISFILGDSDQPFSSEYIFFAGNYTVLPVECDHFGYFFHHGAWPQVENYLKEILVQILSVSTD